MIPPATLTDLDHVHLELGVFRSHFVEFPALLHASLVSAKLVSVDIGDVGQLDLAANRALGLGRLPWNFAARSR